MMENEFQNSSQANSAFKNQIDFRTLDLSEVFYI